MAASEDLTTAVKALAMKTGFARVAVACAGTIQGEEAYRCWLAAGYGGQMAYLGRYIDKRFEPGRLLGGAKSVICLAVGYAPPHEPAPSDAAVARYARGRDYHRLLKRRCRKLMDRLREIEPRFLGRAFVDSAPIAERSLAAAAGLGWIGRNGCLFAPALGSYVLLCEIVCNLPLRADEPLACQCENCDRCVQACPTGALLGDGMLDARRCISYLTIEHRGDIEPDLRPLMERRVFGCDRCQEVCPHNRDIPPGDAELLARPSGLACAGLKEVLTWDRSDWDLATRGSATRRAGYEMLLHNAVIAAGNSQDGSLIPYLEKLAGHPGLTEPVEWALRRLA